VSLQPIHGRRTPIASAIAVCCRRANLRRTIPIALFVGTLLTLIDQGDVLIHGQASAATESRSSSTSWFRSSSQTSAWSPATAAHAA